MVVSVWAHLWVEWEVTKIIAVVYLHVLTTFRILQDIRYGLWNLADEKLHWSRSVHLHLLRPSTWWWKYIKVTFWFHHCGLSHLKRLRFTHQSADLYHLTSTSSGQSHSHPLCQLVVFVCRMNTEVAKGHSSDKNATSGLSARLPTGPQSQLFSL